MPYRLVRKKLKGCSGQDPYINDPNNLEAVVAALFPNHEASLPPLAEKDEPDSYAPFCAEELTATAKRIQTARALGPDGIPSAATKIAAIQEPELMLTVFNACL